MDFFTGLSYGLDPLALVDDGNFAAEEVEELREEDPLLDVLDVREEDPLVSLTYAWASSLQAQL